MAEWNAPLPDEAVEGDPTHVEDHNLIVAALTEARQQIDEIVTSLLDAQQQIDEIVVPDITALASRVYVDNAIAGIVIPSVEGLATEAYVDAAIPDPVDTSSFATKAELADKADATALDGKVAGLNGITGLWAGTQAEYDALPSRSPAVAYIIVEGAPEGQEVGAPVFTSGGTVATSSVTPENPAPVVGWWGFIAIVASEQPTQTWAASFGAWQRVFDQSQLDSAYNRSVAIYAAPAGSSPTAMSVVTPGLMVAATAPIRYQPVLAVHSGTGGTTDANNVSTRTLPISSPAVPLGIAVTYYGSGITAPDLPAVPGWVAGHAGPGAVTTGRVLSLHLKVEPETDVPTVAVTSPLTPPMGAVPWSRSVALGVVEA